MQKDEWELKRGWCEALAVVVNCEKWDNPGLLPAGTGQPRV